MASRLAPARIRVLKIDCRREQIYGTSMSTIGSRKRTSRRCKDTMFSSERVQRLSTSVNQPAVILSAQEVRPPRNIPYQEKQQSLECEVMQKSTMSSVPFSAPPPIPRIRSSVSTYLSIPITAAATKLHD